MAKNAKLESPLPKKRRREGKLKPCGLTMRELKLVAAFQSLGMKRGTLEAAAEMAGISYVHARDLVRRPEVKAKLDMKRIEVRHGPFMDREERLRWLSDMVRDPGNGGRVQLAAMHMLNQMTCEYRTPGDDEANPLHVETTVRTPLAERIAKIRGAGG